MSDITYTKAKSEFDNKNYDSAYDLFVSIGSYSDSEEMAKECIYQKAITFANEKDWENANPLFEQIKDYKDSGILIHYCEYKPIDIKDSTCSETGYRKSKCDCGNIEEVITASLGHNYSNATCNEPQKCSRCGETFGSALGHTSSGTQCSRCGIISFNFTGKWVGTKYNNDSLAGYNAPIPELTITYNSDGSYSIFAKWDSQDVADSYFWYFEGVYDEEKSGIVYTGYHEKTVYDPITDDSGIERVYNNGSGIISIQNGELKFNPTNNDRTLELITFEITDAVI